MESTMFVPRAMSQYPVPFVPSMPSYIETQYLPTVPNAVLSTSAPHDMERHSPTIKLPPSPSSSTGEQRVSRAKKGKRVHACEYPGCNKIFTRAEHRRRHELSHKAKKSFVCTHEGCGKAFHRADYLTQHMARHDPASPKGRTPSLVNSSSPVSAAPSATFSVKSPVLQGYHSPMTNPSAETLSSAGPSNMMVTNCFHCQNQVHNCGNHENASNQYPAGIDHNSATSFPLLGSLASPLSSSLESAIDQYLRSVLRPEAFITPMQPQEHVDSPFWSGNIDPHLSQLSPSTFQTPTSYTWTTGPGIFPSHVQTAPQVHHHSPRPDNDS